MIKSIAFGFMSSENQAFLFKQARMNPVGEAVQDGFMQEYSDKFTAPYSAYSYEDLPSDKFGADFGSNYFDPQQQTNFWSTIRKLF